jgi:hypothetical protein
VLQPQRFDALCLHFIEREGTQGIEEHLGMLF